MFSAISEREDALYLLDQRKLPGQEEWVRCPDLESVAEAIELMIVRGAPAIACAAAFGLSRFASDAAFDHMELAGFLPEFSSAVARLRRTRPTAVNLFHALDGAEKVLMELPPDQRSSRDFREALKNFSDFLFRSDFELCCAIGRHGSSLAFPGQKLNVMTHCNTGALATAGYGTALGVVRALYEKGSLGCVFVDETRPWLQGARLTAFELEKEGIPYILHTEAAAAYLMQTQKIDLIVVGADRIACNGDTANKIGTYALAVLAKYHKLRFVVAAPWSTFDPHSESGSAIKVEERPESEVLYFAGIRIAPDQAKAVNPSFDITPADLIDAIVTETGILEGNYREQIQRHFDQVNH